MLDGTAVTRRVALTRSVSRKVNMLQFRNLCTTCESATLISHPTRERENLVNMRRKYVHA